MFHIEHNQASTYNLWLKLRSYLYYVSPFGYTLNTFYRHLGLETGKIKVNLFKAMYLVTSKQSPLISSPHFISLSCVPF